MFIIPCKYLLHQSSIIECINSIKKFHPNELIIVVDSNSDDTSYFDLIINIPGVVLAKKRNLNYVIGALWIAYEEYPNESCYVLIHDSIIIKQSLDEFLNDDKSYSFTYFEESNYHGKIELEIINRFINPNYTFDGNHAIGIFGSTCILKQNIIKKFIKNNLHQTFLPIDKIECQTAERALGICLTQENVDIIENCVEKVNCLQNWGLFDSDGFKYLKKYFKFRH